MGIFYNKLMAESAAVEDAIQTPDDIGVDLDAVEKAIVGDDGCEAHRDEIDDAMEGVVGEPMEEAATIMYESEYNFNQIMKCIGMAELSEVAAGRDFVLEAGSENSNSFWEKIRAGFVKMFESITKAYDYAVRQLETRFGQDKAFVQKFHADIKDGFENGEWTFKGYDLDVLNAKYEPVNCKLEDGFNAAVADALNWNRDNDANLDHAKVIKDVSKRDCADVGELKDKLTKELFVSKEYTNKNSDDAVLNTAVGIMNSNGDTQLLRNAYRDIKAQYKQLFTLLKDYQASVNKEAKAEKDETVSQYYSKCTSICTAYVTIHKYEKNVQHLIFSSVLSAHKARRNQARAMTRIWYRASKNGKSEEKPKAKEVSESALFNVTII